MNSSQIPGNFCVFLFIWFWYGKKKLLFCKKPHFQQENMCSWMKKKDFTMKYQNIFFLFCFIILKLYFIYTMKFSNPFVYKTWKFST